MGNDFFSRDDVQDALGKYITLLREFSSADDSTNVKTSRLVDTILGFVNFPENWNDKTEISIKHYSQRLLFELNKQSVSEESIDLIYSYFLNFLIERKLNSQEDLPIEYANFIDFATYSTDCFSIKAKMQIEYALRGLPLEVVNNLIHSRRFKEYEKFPQLVATAERLISDWDENLGSKISEIKDLESSLKKHEIAFNFVGLYAGFSKLGRIKKEEYCWAKRIMFLLGVLIPLPLIAEAIYMLSMPVEALANYSYLIKTIPIFSLTLIMIYYFRISLNNYNSIRAQIMQIELRKSLCRFIQSYAEYVKGVKSNGNESLLVKFEEIIFSNIMTSEEKVPSTFDGLEQLAGLIGAVKGSKGK